MERIKDRTRTRLASEGPKRAAELGRRAYGQARSQLRTVVADALPSSLYRFTGRSRTQAKMAERLRDAVYRDRGLHAALAQAAGPLCEPEDGPSMQPETPERAPDADCAPIDEPICTRTMARLLAQQGCTERALRIYEVLLQKTPDPELRQEAEALRATSAPT